MTSSLTVYDRRISENTNFPDHIVAKAVALLETGYTNRAVERELRRYFPHEATPSRETIRHWDKSIAESCHEESETREQRIIALADDIIAEGLQAVAGDPQAIIKNLMALNAVRGTFADKQFKRKQLELEQSIPSLAQFVFVLVDQRDDTPTFNADLP